jgi:hypothetical protein
MSKRRKLSVDVHVPEKGELAPFVGYYANSNPHAADGEAPGFELHQHQVNDRIQRHVLVGRQVRARRPLAMEGGAGMARQLPPPRARRRRCPAHPTHLGALHCAPNALSSRPPLPAGRPGLRGARLRQGRGRAADVPLRAGPVQQADGQAAGAAAGPAAALPLGRQPTQPLTRPPLHAAQLMPVQSNMMLRVETKLHGLDYGASMAEAEDEVGAGRRAARARAARCPAAGPCRASLRSAGGA